VSLPRLLSFLPFFPSLPPSLLPPMFSYPWLLSPWLQMKPLLIVLLGTKSQLTAVHDTTHFNELLVSNRANGYRDLLAVIDLSTYRRLSWEKNLPFFLVSFIVPETGEYLAVDPRSALKGVLEKAEEKGWTCMSGAEFEVGPSSLFSLERCFYLFSEDRPL
jgi:hypothetical protein